MLVGRFSRVRDRGIREYRLGECEGQWHGQGWHAGGQGGGSPGHWPPYPVLQDGKECVVKEVVPGDSVNSLLSILDVITVSDQWRGEGQGGKGTRLHSVDWVGEGPLGGGNL